MNQQYDQVGSIHRDIGIVYPTGNKHLVTSTQYQLGFVVVLTIQDYVGLQREIPTSLFGGSVLRPFVRDLRGSQLDHSPLGYVAEIIGQKFLNPLYGASFDGQCPVVDGFEGVCFQITAPIVTDEVIWIG